MAYSLIETVEIGAGGAASIEFTSIPQDAQDLELKVSGRGTDAFAQTSVYLQLNSDTGTNYDNLGLRGFGSGSASRMLDAGVNFLRISYGQAANTAANTFHSSSTYFPNYTSSAEKSIFSKGVLEDNVTGAYQLLLAGRWSGTTGITSIKVYKATGFGNWDQYTKASLYKIS